MNAPSSVLISNQAARFLYGPHFAGAGASSSIFAAISCRYQGDPRALEDVTQDEFSERYKLPVGTVRDWEQHSREPDTASRVYLSMIEAEPEGVQNILAKV